MADRPPRARVCVRDVPLVVSTFSRASDPDPVERVATLSDIFGDHEEVGGGRHALPGFSTARFRPGGSRRAADMIDSSAMVLDVDGISEKAAGVLFRVLDKADYAYGVYSTLSHDEADALGHRYRVVLPFSRPASAAEYRATFVMLKTLVKVRVDPSSADPVHQWLLPYKYRGGRAMAMFFHDGKLLEPQPVSTAPLAAVSGAMPVPSYFDVDGLRAWVVAHPSKDAEIQRATQALCDGEDWEDGDRGGRDPMLWSAVASIAMRSPGVTTDVLADFIEPSVIAARAAGSKMTMKIARDQIRRAIEQSEKTPRSSAPKPPKRLGRRIRLLRVSAFVGNMLDRTDKGVMPGQELRELYEAWAAENGGAAHWKDFSYEMKSLGIESKKVRGKTMWPVTIKKNPLPGPGLAPLPGE